MRHPIMFATAAALALAFATPASAGNAPLKRVEPVYPPAALRAGTTGFVEVEYTIDPSGKVASVSVLDAKPARTFEAAVVRAVKQWEFAPGTDSRGKVRLEFSL